MDCLLISMALPSADSSVLADDSAPRFMTLHSPVVTPECKVPSVQSSSLDALTRLVPSNVDGGSPSLVALGSLCPTIH